MGFDIPTLQLIAYSALTCASVIVASVSLIFGYHQNFGWKPILFPTSIEIGHVGDNKYRLNIEFKVWNRRKYPIVVLTQDVDFEKLSYIGTTYFPDTVNELATWRWSGTLKFFMDKTGHWALTFLFLLSLGAFFFLIQSFFFSWRFRVFTHFIKGDAGKNLDFLLSFLFGACFIFGSWLAVVIVAGQIALIAR